MNKRILLLSLIALLAYSCKNNDKTTADITISPEAGTSYKSGDVITARLNLPADTKPDSVVYLLDSARLISAKDSSAVKIKTDRLGLGARVITAKVYQGGKSTDVSTNVILLAAKAPEQLTYVVEKTFPHDTASYTEGLQYADGVMYESDGGVLNSDEGQSSLRKTDLTTGRILKFKAGDPKIFSEGLSVVGDKVIQLTWKEKIGYVYNKTTFELINTFNNNVGVEGWGLCFDGTKLYMDDSTNRIWFLDKDKFNAIGYIDVYDDKGPINSLNELEFINGKIYANVYQTDLILVIDPKTGTVLQRIDMANLWPLNQRPAIFDNGNNVLNGIAYDKATNRTFVTGKKWPKMYQVKFVKK